MMPRPGVPVVWKMRAAWSVSLSTQTDQKVVTVWICCTVAASRASTPGSCEQVRSSRVPMTALIQGVTPVLSPAPAAGSRVERAREVGSNAVVLVRRVRRNPFGPTRLVGP